MPPKTKFGREEIIRAAFDQVSSEGLSALTARSVARQLGSSTAPVYQQFENMHDLELEVIRKAMSMILEYTRESYTDHVFLNMGTGIAVFSREHPQLYHSLFLECNCFRTLKNEFIDSMEKQMATDKRLSDLTRKEKCRLLETMWTYTHGLASQICVGLIDENSTPYIINNLLEVGSVVIADAIMKSKSANKKNKE